MLQAGTVLRDRYQFKEKLGQDASRQTWLAVDLGVQLQEPVIVKLLALSPQMHWDEFKLFEREAQVLQNLNHPRIPQYRDYFVLDHQPGSRFSWFGMVQSYIPGASLQQLLNQGQHFTKTWVEKIAIEVLTILVYLHELSPPVLHRDIKPSNLIWGKDERVYLVDFGAVQDQAVVEGATFTVVGTYGYVPMEQFGGRPVPASDLYGLGATLIHLLTGIAPADLPQSDARIEFANRVSLDLGLVNWIGKLTEPDLAERLSTARQALKAFENRHNLSPPIISPRPTGSQIQLKKSASQLKIKIPKRGFKALVTCFVLVGVLIYIPMFYPVLGYWSWLIMLCLSLPLLSLWFRETDIYFNREDCEIRWKLFGICYWRRRTKTSKIYRVYEQEAPALGADQGVTIAAGSPSVFDYSWQLTTSPLSTVERLWLIREIRDWLGLHQ